jgi:hypothetical protein
MVWFYTRDQQALRLETRYDNNTLEYVGIVVDSTGDPDISRFKTLDAFRAWLVNLEQTLTANQWTPEGAPHVLADGWPDKTPRH